MQRSLKKLARGVTRLGYDAESYGLLAGRKSSLREPEKGGGGGRGAHVDSREISDYGVRRGLATGGTVKEKEQTVDNRRFARAIGLYGA